MSLTEEKIKFLEKKAVDIRCSIIEMLMNAKSGHLAGALGMVDIFTYLYFAALNHNPQKPKWEYRDRLVLSNGHISPVLYATLAHAGYFPLEQLNELRKFGSALQGHPDRNFIPVETTSGPLGCGLSQAIGMALADRIDRGPSSGRQFYCLISDGELDEGNTWEAIMLAGKEKIQNLTVIIDRNNIQVGGLTEDIMPLNPLAEKWRDWNWHVQEIDGHNFSQIDRAVSEARAVHDRPSVIIAYTIPSKGIPEFERQYQWHGKIPATDEEIKIVKSAMKNLRAGVEQNNISQ